MRSASTCYFVVRNTPDHPGAELRLSVEQLCVLVQAGQLAPEAEGRPDEAACWAPLVAWAEIGLPAPPPARHLPLQAAMPAELRALHDEQRDQLRWWLRTGGQIRGPLAASDVRQQLTTVTGGHALVGLVGGACWFAASSWLGDSLASAGATEHGAGEPADLWRPAADVAASSERCLCCLELFDGHQEHCPHCGERVAPASSLPSSTRPLSIADDPPDASWLRMHWRPLVTIGAIGSLIAGGIALRYLAPDRYRPPNRIAAPPAAAPACDTRCWHGEACELGHCVWHAPNDVGHLPPSPTIAGPFELPPGVVDVLPLDANRLAAASMQGVHILSARNGAPISLISDAPHAQRLYRVGDAMYAAAPRRIFVIDVASTRVLKTIETGSPVGSIAVGAGGQRALVSLPVAHAAAVIATDFNAEISRFDFGDDRVVAVALDDTGKRALTTNGLVPLAGLAAPRHANQFGGMYAFDPNRLPSTQDRVRTAMVGNPADIVMLPDSKTSYAVLREQDTVVRVEQLPTGAVRQSGRMSTCHQPEQIELVRQGRRAVVRCNLGRALEVFSLSSHQLVRQVPLSTRATDMVVSPDGMQAAVALPRRKRGAIGLLDMKSYQLTTHELAHPPWRMRLAPDGRVAAVLSERGVAVWVVR